MKKLIQFNNLDNLDFEKIGFKCGLEIHQQLNTGKLFCNCPCNIISNSLLTKKVERKLRFSLSEMGDVDKAALDEFKKGKYNIYQYNDEISCLVDLDEEPPQSLPNKLAFDTALRVGIMLDIKFFNKAQFMRKLIIDGSISTGFQRTSMLGINRKLKTKFGDIEISGINIEEDSSRTISREHTHTIFSLDRQGIPLIEITTAPQIKTPDQVFDTATQIGNILRSFPEVKRGLGTIRQDLNVSIDKGSRIEIKGAQNLKMLSEIALTEAKRQLVYLSILDELKLRNIDETNFSDKIIYDITQVFKETKSKLILDNLKEKENRVLAIKLNNFEEILGCEMQDNYRFATEISDRNKSHFPMIYGLVHSDENLSKYTLTQLEIDEIKSKLNMKKNDSFIFIVNKENIAKKSLEYILEIISQLIKGIPTEVRQVDPKGTVTKFLRHMPGSARMYPETDVLEIEISKNYLMEMKKDLPELYDLKIERLKKEFELEDSKLFEMLEIYEENQIRDLIKISDKSAGNLYNIIFDLPKDIKKRDNIEPIDFKLSLLEDLLSISKKENLTQKMIRDIFVSLYKDKLNEVNNLKEYLDKNGLLALKIDDYIIENKLIEIVKKNVGAPKGALIGYAMKEFGGKIEGKKISDILDKLLK